MILPSPQGKPKVQRGQLLIFSLSNFVWWVVAPLVIAFGIGALLGAPYLPIRRQDKESLLDIANLRPGQSLIDLGSGDGTFLKSAAQRGIRATGYEINPLLCVMAYARCFRYRKLVKVRWSNFWSQPLPQTDAIYVFLISRYMPKLERKLQEEVKNPTTVISYVFELPSLAPEHQTRNAFIYKLPVKH